MTTTALAQAISQLTLNPRYTVGFGDGRFCVVQFPGGYWAVKVRQRGQQWIAFAVPRLTTALDPFLIAVGDDRDTVHSFLIRWAEQTKALACRMDAVVFAGYGNATHERLNTDDLAARWAALDTQERQ